MRVSRLLVSLGLAFAVALPAFPQSSAVKEPKPPTVKPARPQPSTAPEAKQDAGPAARAKTLFSQGYAAFHAGNYKVSRDLFQDGLALTLKRPGKPDRRLLSEPSEFYLSDDGKREAYAVRTAETPPRT